MDSQLAAYLFSAPPTIRALLEHYDYWLEPVTA